MTQIRISVGEHWTRQYIIEAENFEDAVKKYKEWAFGNGSENGIESLEPEYLEDIEDDIIEIQN